MKQVVIVSGKGGTGKTSFTSSLANVIAGDPEWTNLVLVDADVDAANLNLVLEPDIVTEHTYSGGVIAEIDDNLCTACGICADACHFSAITHIDHQYLIDPFGCEGCTLCERICPAQAITMKPQQNGTWYHSRTRLGDCFHADLFPGQGNSGKLVTTIKQQAEQWAKKHENTLMLIDGPPGTGCPVMAAITGADLAIIVTEPSISGLHDAQRIRETLQHFHISVLVVINKFDLNLQASQQIIKYCEKQQIPIAGNIPFTPVFTEAMNQGKTIQEVDDQTELKETFQQIWQVIKRNL